MVDREAVIAEKAALLEEARRFEIPIVYTRHLHRPDYLDAPLLVRERFTQVQGLVAGTWDAEVHDALAPHPRDAIVDKNRYDAFLYTDMEVVLRRVRCDVGADHRGGDERVRGVDGTRRRHARLPRVRRHRLHEHDGGVPRERVAPMAGLDMHAVPWRDALPAMLQLASASAE